MVLLSKAKLIPSKLPFVRLVIASFGLNVGTIGFLLLVKKNLPPEVPLFYGLPEGQAQITNTLGLAIPALISTGLTLINITASIILEDDFLKKTLILTSFVVTVFSTVTTLKIIFLVGSF